MNCPQCGGGVPDAAAFCPFCGSPQPQETLPDREETRAIFDEIRDSDAWRFRQAIERISQLPTIPAFFRAIPIFVITFVIIVALFVAGAFGRMGLPGGGIGIMAILVPLFIIGVAASIGFAHFKKMRAFDTAETDARPVLIRGKRQHVSGGGNSSARTTYHLTAEFEDGSREEFALLKPDVYSTISEGDAGVLFTKSTFALDFDYVTRE